MRKLFAKLLILSFFSSATFAHELLVNSKQLLVMTTKDWSTTTGILQRMERHSIDDDWQIIGDSIQASVGKNGMGWACHHIDENITFNEPIKMEGDNKAPAGILDLGSAFGFNPIDDYTTLKLPYLFLHPAIEAIDDVNSMFYNQIIDTTTLSLIEWNSSEKMGLEPLYKWGLIIEYNTHTPQVGYGSCIFMHIWKSREQGTTGCTAMNETDLLTLLYWLDPDAKPKLVQLPKDAYIKLKDTWNLPELKFNE